MAFMHQEPIEIIRFSCIESDIPRVAKFKEICRIILEKGTWIGLITTLKQSGLQLRKQFATLPRKHKVFLSQQTAHSFGYLLLALDEKHFNDNKKPFIREYHRIGNFFLQSQRILIKNKNDHFKCI